jgi:hypothetical protein
MSLHFTKTALLMVAAGLITPLLATHAPTRIGAVMGFIQDKDGKALTAASAGSTMLYESRAGRAIMAPDGHQVSLAEFSSVRGTASVKCLPGGTEVQIQLSGLLPNATYTVWLLTFKAPGFDSGGLNNLIGVGALGRDAGGNGNIIYADENGLGEITEMAPGRALSAKGSIGNCFSQDEFETHIVGAYHLDGSTWGTTPGPAGTFVEQFGFRFQQIVRPYSAVKDSAGNAIAASTSLDTPVFEGRTGAPVTAPDGHQITLREFRAVNGAATARCTANAKAPGLLGAQGPGTIYSMHLNGLIPNGVYTAWMFTFDAGGGSGPPKAAGAIGPYKGAWGNTYVADQNGEADIYAVNPAGALSANGVNVAGCWLTGEAEVHILGAYHIDGQTHGAVPGAANTWLEQFEFDFVRPQ